MSARRTAPDTPVTLSEQSVEAIVDALAERLRGSQPPHDLIDAAEVARRLGISRDTVYARAEEFGAIRIGTGPRARLRFDPDRIAAPPSEQAPPPPTRRPRRRRAPTDVALLPVGRKRGGP